MVRRKRDDEEGNSSLVRGKKGPESERRRRRNSQTIRNITKAKEEDGIRKTSERWNISRSYDEQDIHTDIHIHKKRRRT